MQLKISQTIIQINLYENQIIYALHYFNKNFIELI